MKTIKILKTNSSNAENKGTLQESFSIEEYNDLIASGAWQGGTVEGRGYLPPFNLQSFSNLSNPYPQNKSFEGQAYGRFFYYDQASNCYRTWDVSYFITKVIRGLTMYLGIKIQSLFTDMANPAFLSFVPTVSVDDHLSPQTIPFTEGFDPTTQYNYVGTCSFNLPLDGLVNIDITVTLNGISDKEDPHDQNRISIDPFSYISI